MIFWSKLKYLAHDLEGLIKFFLENYAFALDVRDQNCDFTELDRGYDNRSN